MKKPETMLKQVSKELEDSKKVLKRENKELKQRKGKLEKSHKKRILKTIELGVEGLEDHRDILKEQVLSEARQQRKRN
jgi:hypothetical protein